MQVLPHTMTMIKFDMDIGVKLVVYIINSESQPYTKVGWVEKVLGGGGGDLYHALVVEEIWESVDM